MEYALQLLIPILLGLGLGAWLTQTYGVSPIWGLVLAGLGFVGGLGVVYKRHILTQKLWVPPKQEIVTEPLRLSSLMVAEDNDRTDDPDDSTAP